MRPWLFRLRLRKLLVGGDAAAFKANIEQRDYKVLEMVHLLGNYGKQLRILYDQYFIPLESLFGEKAYTLMDPNGFELRTFVEYKHAIKQMAMLYKQVKDAVS